MKINRGQSGCRPVLGQADRNWPEQPKAEHKGKSNRVNFDGHSNLWQLLNKRKIKNSQIKRNKTNKHTLTYFVCKTETVYPVEGIKVNHGTEKEMGIGSSMQRSRHKMHTHTHTYQSFNRSINRRFRKNRILGGKERINCKTHSISNCRRVASSSPCPFRTPNDRPSTKGRALFVALPSNRL